MEEIKEMDYDSKESLLGLIAGDYTVQDLLDLDDGDAQLELAA